MKWDKGLKVQRDGIWYQDPKVGYPCECNAEDVHL